MPTGNEFTDVRFGQQDQSYKQTDRDMSPGWDANVTADGQQPTSGQYPNVYDRAAGSEPHGQESDDNPFYYPNRAYEEIKCTGPGQSYVTSERESVSGEFTTCRPEQVLGKFSPDDNMIPTPVPSKQFSSDKEGDPKVLVRQAQESIKAHADMMHAYGYNMPVSTLGSHPWLRDELADPGEMEPGNTEPKRDFQVPKSQRVPPPVD